MDSNFDDTRPFDYTDAELVGYITSLPSLPNYSNIIPLSSKYLVKDYRQDQFEDAAESMKLASQLDIHVPHIRRVIQHDRGLYCIMDRIPGATLDMAWPKLGWISSLRLAFQLRRVIHRLRSVVSTSSGSLATGKCRSYFLEDWYGLPLRATSQQVISFLNFWANFISNRQEIQKTPAEHVTCPRPVFSSCCPLVFTHHDLAPRNIILDPEGQLWLIDWDCAGFYPKFFEYAGMYNFIPTSWTKFALWRWKLLAWIAGGLYDRECRWLEIIRSRFTRFLPARRFNMKANGYAAAAGKVDNDS